MKNIYIDARIKKIVIGTKVQIVLEADKVDGAKLPTLQALKGKDMLMVSMRDPQPELDLGDIGQNHG